jgi:large subunit ribosomal protein L24
MSTHVKKDDEVVVISGGHKGKSGTVLAVNPKKLQVFIKGIHMIKKHVKKSQASEGGIIEKEGPIHISNVRLAAKTVKEPAKASKAAKPAAKKAPAKKRAKAATE